MKVEEYLCNRCIQSLGDNVNLKSASSMRGRSAVISATFITCFTLATTAACSKKEPPPAPPPEVQVTAVNKQDVPIYIELVGATLGSEDVEIRAPVEGALAAMRTLAGPLRGEVEAVIGYVEEGVAKRNLDFFHVR